MQWLWRCTFEKNEHMTRVLCCACYCSRFHIFDVAPRSIKLDQLFLFFWYQWKSFWVPFRVYRATNFVGIFTIKYNFLFFSSLFWSTSSTAISSIYPSVLVTCIYNTAGRRSQNELGAINRSYFELFCFCDFCVEAQLYNGSCRKYNWEDPAYFYF